LLSYSSFNDDFGQAALNAPTARLNEANVVVVGRRSVVQDLNRRCDIPTVQGDIKKKTTKRRIQPQKAKQSSVAGLCNKSTPTEHKIRRQRRFF
jgi:hypothetical protein